MPRLRILFPTAWDRQQLAARPDLVGDDEVLFATPDDADCATDFAILDWIDRRIEDWCGDTDGVFSASDYPGAAAVAAIGSALGLPATAPADLLRSAHKTLARAVHASVAPDATPRWQAIDLDRPAPPDPALGWPRWVKPAKGTFSRLARRVASPREYADFLAEPLLRLYRDDYLRIHRQFVARYLGAGVDAGEFLAEQELRGRLVTVEVFATGDRAVPLGVVDSVLHEQTGSFIAFEYPSTLPESVQRRMEGIACELALAFRLRWTSCNVEMMWDAAQDRIGIVELNPRLCGQFADLYEKVDGVHGHRIAFDLALGRVPKLRRRSGPCAVAASYPLRVFEPSRVLAAPDERRLAAAQALYPGTLCWNEVVSDQLLEDFADGEDGHSHRYAVVNLGASSRAELAARRDAVVAALDYRFSPLPRGFA